MAILDTNLENALGVIESLKKEKTVFYVEGLLSSGGPCTNVFKKNLGEEKTAEVFRKYLFGTEA